MIAASLVALAACRADPECYFDDECDSRSRCVQQTCVRAAALLDASTTVPTWRADIEGIFERACIACHANPPVNDAPFPLVTFDDTQAAFEGIDIFLRLTDRVFAATTPGAAIPYDLSDDEVSLIAQWVAAETPIGDPPPMLSPDGGVVGSDGGLPAGPIANAQTALPIQDGFGKIGDIVWNQRDGVLLFSDESTETVYELEPPATEAELSQSVREGRGLSVDQVGVIVTTLQDARAVARGGGLIAQNFRGDRFNAPYDVLTNGGQTYFTDPTFGLGLRPREIPFNGLYRLDPLGLIVAEWRGSPLSGPSGLALSPDESWLYMSESVDGLVLRFDVDSVDGSLGDPELFLAVGNQPSGLAVDAAGNLYVATAIGVQVYSPTGVLFGRIATDQPAGAVAIGGPMNDTVYIGAGGVLLSASLGER